MLGLMLVQMSSMRDALAEALLELGLKDPRIVVLGADTSVSIKTSLFADRYPDRFFNVGIAEANMIGIAAGLALAGKIPYVSIYSSRPDLKVGHVNVLKEGTDVAIIACGVMVNEALEAGESLAKEKISAEIVDCHTLKPLDADTIVGVARKTGGIITAEEQNIIGGLGSAVAESTSSSYPVPISIVGVRDTFGESGEYKELMAKYGLTSKDIVRAAKKLVASR